MPNPRNNQIKLFHHPLEMVSSTIYTEKNKWLKLDSQLDLLNSYTEKIGGQS